MPIRALLLCALTAWALAGPAVAQAGPPDVVVIVADDLGFGDVGYNGSEIQTPEIDRLAAEGVVLDRFYTSPLCSPSRAGLLTGRYGVRMGINEPVTQADTVGLPQVEETLAELLQGAGYQTAMVGKWHLGDDCPFHPELHGFDSFLGMLGGGASYFTRQTQTGLDWWRGVAPVDTGGYTTDLIADEAVEVLARPRDGPLLLYLPFTAPHSPLQALDRDLALYPGLEGERRTFAAMTTALDRAVGRVMAAVRASGRPTLVWFLSDNGAVESLGGDNGPLRGQKGQAYEGAIRVPSVVWYPAWGSRRVEHPVWVYDVLPTVLGLVPDAPAPALPLDGADQGPQLAGAPATPLVLDRLLYSYRRTGADGYWLGVQTAEDKYVEHGLSNGTIRDFYRVRLDPTERADSLRHYLGRAEDLRQAGLAFAALTRPGASSDVSLTVSRAPDLAECPGLLSTPTAPGAAPLGLTVGPNPFSTAATVRVTSPTGRRVVVDLLDVAGRRVRTLFEGSVPAGAERVVRLGRGGLPSGLYVVRASGGGATATRSVVLAR
ncbi:sulfatase-like hydrolase/transferase [Rubrivirga sp.]|uniref:sulfatase-like hydrolase/transferase n=1 Tax=Rubrivirga sp. TaxID=1885344 RepID=UPI003B524F48